jgi:ubiquinone/menaquinone biosynthesis C-methylase UbiE
MTASATPATLRWQCSQCGAGLAMADAVLSCARCGFTIARQDDIWLAAPSFRPSGFTVDRRDHLAEIETHHFWFAARQRLLDELLRRVVGPRRAAIELGCGGGTFLRHLATLFTTIVGVDAYEQSLASARSRAPAATLVQADACRVPFGDGAFDLVAMLDVLEHVAPDLLLAEAARLLVRGGHLLLSVPASRALSSELDVTMGHRCRYSLTQLNDELQRTGFRLLHHTHYQFVLFPLIWLARRAALASVRRSERHPPRAVGAALAAVNRAEVRWLGRRSLPWGSSLVAVAVKS